MKTLTLEEVKIRLKIINPNIEVLSSEYINTIKPMKFKCLKCGYEWESSYKTFVSNPKCKNPINKSKNRILTIEIVKDELLKINPHITILDGEYINAHTHLNCLCSKCGYSWKSTWDNLSKRCGCSNCSGNVKHTIQDITKKMKIINPNIEILSTVYKNTGAKLKCKCRIDDNVWETTWNELRKGSGCRKCALRNNSKEHHHNWKGGISPLATYLRYHTYQWKKDSKKESKYKCVISGQDFKHVHHIYGFDLIMKETLEIEMLELKPVFSDYTADELHRLENTCADLHKKYGLGVALSESEHTLFHQKYGYGENNPSQWAEFLKTRKEFYDKNTNR